MKTSEPLEFTCIKCLLILYVFHTQIIPNHLKFLPYEDGFNKVRNSYIKRAFYGVFEDYGINFDEILMNCNFIIRQLIKRLRKKNEA